MEVKVNKDKCIGCGMCIGTLSDIFDYNDEGLAEVIKNDIGEEFKEDIEEVASSCPGGAILVK